MNTSLYQSIAQRTESNIYIGVVGPVRTGKSTFIKRFMETLVIPHIENAYLQERAKDELPQSGSGTTIMTAEPKFVPEDAVKISLDGDVSLSVRLIDCVGYMVNGAAGRFEDGKERMVSTPWFDHEITMTEAAEVGTHKVISNHSTIGLVITTDGTVCGIPREDYVEPEKRVIQELQAIGKPFIVLVNSADPDSDGAKATCRYLEESYGVSTMCLSCKALSLADITEVLRKVLMEFPIGCLQFRFPSWLEALDTESELLQQVLQSIRDVSEELTQVKHVYEAAAALAERDFIEEAAVDRLDMGSGAVTMTLQLPRALYYETLSQQSGFTITDDGQLLDLLTRLHGIEREYAQVEDALQQARDTGYGIVLPGPEQLQLQEPEIVRQNGKYSVKLKANAPAIHMIMTNVETTVTPAIGGESASEEIINFLLQGFDGDVSRIWESNIFGKSLYELAGEGVNAKISGVSLPARAKFQETLQRVVNEGAGGLICIIL